MTAKHIEIERKFLIKTLPDLSQVKKNYIQQGYITHTDDSVEVEFSSIEEADNFQPADWFGREVTMDKRYKNKALAINPQAIEADE